MCRAPQPAERANREQAKIESESKQEEIAEETEVVECVSARWLRQPVACRSLRGSDKKKKSNVNSRKRGKALRENVEKKPFPFSVFFVVSVLEMDDKCDTKGVISSHYGSTDQNVRQLYNIQWYMYSSSDPYRRKI